jgi:EAL domain-containing protein (putative c-di-GMP-specific phosphodiesterase class I)
MRVQLLFPDALRNEEFSVYYQPKVDIRTGEIIGAEALCRWFHEGEMISPDAFIPMLEETNDICKLDFYMLEHACRDIRRWMDEGRKVVRISVNLSRKHMINVNLLDNLLKIIDRHNVPHSCIEIELTETTTDVGFSDLKRVVTGLQSVGIFTSVDDFGVGYSSLNLIRELPWNVIKVDKSFLPQGDNEMDDVSKIMFKHVIQMTTEMGIECIVEGVETVKQRAILEENNCCYAQGFLYDRPLPKNEFEERLIQGPYSV